MLPPNNERRPAEGGAALGERPGGPSAYYRANEAAPRTPTWPVPVGFRPFTWAVLDDETVAPVVVLDDEPVAPVVVRRQPLPSNYEWITWQILRLVEALAAYQLDDRYPRYRWKVAQRNLPRLNRAAAMLHDIRRDLRGDDGHGWSP